MDRRSFLAGLGALVGGIAIEQAIPLGRVWSFPKEIKCINATGLKHLSTVWYDRRALELLEKNLKFAAIEDYRFSRGLRIGGTINIRKPARYVIADA